jgi:peptidyl-prolyl cis-trans isomerase A (cyclophilin A)
VRKLVVGLVLAVTASASVTVGAQKPSFATPAASNERPPAIFRARFETTKGTFVVEVERDWAPLGAARFYNLVRSGFYDGCRFFRVIDSRIAQAGMSGDPAVQDAWAAALIADDPSRESNRRGTIAMASAGPQSRATQFYINLADNGRAFDRQSGAAPLGRIVSGMDVVDSLYSGYGEGAPRGRGPAQERIRLDGNAYLEREFPKLDYIVKARLEK